MARLTDKDYREVLNLVYLANRCENLESFIDALFPSMMQAFNTECATFHLIKGYPRHIRIVESRSFKSDSHNIYEDKYYPSLYKDSFYQHSPLLTEALSSPKTALKIGESISFREWDRSVLYNDFIRPQHLYWELFVSLSWRNNLEGMITLWRPKNQPDYGDTDVLKAQVLAPHLGVAIHNICLISQINIRERYSLSADKTNSEGVLWLDHRFTPSFFHDKARDICLQLLGKAQYNTPDFEKGEFPIPSYIIRDCSDLLGLIKEDKQPRLLSKERTIFTKSGKKFRIEYSLIWEGTQISSMPDFIVNLSDLTEENKLETALQNRFHLSERELEIIRYLSKGLSNSEIGEKLYISRQTVHTHIKNVYRKLGIGSRIELYRMVMQENYPRMFNHQIG